MSHFTVLVTKTNKTPLDEQLAPFDENTEMPRYVKYTKEQLIGKKRKEFEEYRDTTYAKFLADPEAYKASTTNERHLQYIEHEFPQRFNWTDEDFYKEAIKYEEKEDLTSEGGIYSTYNPRSKWDWYKVGGRWTGYFKLKKGATGRLGEPGVGGNKPEYDADIALAKDIDWKNMEQPTSTFAVLHNGEWYEKGEMGWWAMVSNEKSPEDWQAQFDKIISSLDPEDEVTVVDAHI